MRLPFLRPISTFSCGASLLPRLRSSYARCVLACVRLVYVSNTHNTRTTLQIHARLAAANGGSVLIVRTSNAITFAMDHPRRHVQVILRLYHSPAEILLGFDVDSSAVSSLGFGRFIF
jgi:hypothetical protein